MYYDFTNFVLIDPEREADSLVMGPESYILSVKAVINRIAQTDTGRKVFKTLRLWNRGVRIAPYNKLPAFPGDRCGPGGGAQAFPEDGDLPIYRKANHPLRPWSPVAKFVTRSTIRFTPERFLQGGGCNQKYSNKINNDYVPTPDEVLLHELMHGVRQVTETHQWSVRTSGAANLFAFDEMEEFIAVIGECIYQSELRKDLRWGHNGFVHPEKELQDSFAFYKASQDVFMYVDAWCISNPHFTKRLSKVRAPFNPLAAYYADKDRCRRNSQSGEAFNRDVKAAEHELGINWFKVVTPRYPAIYWKSLMETGSARVN